MAKNDNLTDFLRGIADRLRALLGTADPINPQDFEDKIQTVRDEAYSQGFAEGGPTGITATAPDVLSGKVFGSGGSAKATGTILVHLKRLLGDITGQIYIWHLRMAIIRPKRTGTKQIQVRFMYQTQM